MSPSNPRGRLTVLGLATLGMSINAGITRALGQFGAARQPRISFHPPRRLDQPHSSIRQQERYCRQGLHTKVVNGFPVLQTKPSKAR